MGVYKTIMMDYTRSCHRGKWNLIDSIIGGSSNLFIMLGGYLADQYGVVGLFFIVSICNLVNLIPLIVVWIMTRDNYNLKVAEGNKRAMLGS